MIVVSTSEQLCLSRRRDGNSYLTTGTWTLQKQRQMNTKTHTTKLVNLNQYKITLERCLHNIT